MYWKSVKLEDCEKDYVILNFYIQFYLPVSQGVREKARIFETLNFFGKGLTQIATDVQLL